MDLNNSTTPEDEKDRAQTPWWFVRAVEAWQGAPFDLDVCANAATAKCDLYYSLQEMGIDSLQKPWMPNNWCNPPYSDILPWVYKAAAEAERGNRTVMLIPDKPEVLYCREAWRLAAAVYHMPFRLNFLRPDGSRFVDAAGKPQGPKSPVWLVVFHGKRVDPRPLVDYIDLRVNNQSTDK
jgi:phage N-6-adenine-methyltransferase